MTSKVIPREEEVSRSLLYSTYFYNHLFFCIRVRLELVSANRPNDSQHFAVSCFEFLYLTSVSYVLTCI